MDARFIVVAVLVASPTLGWAESLAPADHEAALKEEMMSEDTLRLRDRIRDQSAAAAELAAHEATTAAGAARVSGDDEAEARWVAQAKRCEEVMGSFRDLDLQDRLIALAGEHPGMKWTRANMAARVLAVALATSLVLEPRMRSHTRTRRRC